MSFDAERGVLPVHPLAVIGHSDEASAAGLQLHLEDGGTCVDRILDEFLHDACRSLDHLAGSDLVDHPVFEDANHRRFGSPGRRFCRNAIRMGVPSNP